MPVPDFEFENDITVPAEIKFENKSEYADRYIWDFGDGSSSNETSPSYIFNHPGSYFITLNAINDEGSKSITKTLTVWSNKYKIYNATSIDSPSMFICFNEGTKLVDMVKIGTIPSGKNLLC